MEESAGVNLEELLSDLRGGATLLAKDLIDGIEMFRVVASMMLLFSVVFAVFALYNLYLLPLYQGAPCCWVLSTYDLVGGLAGIAGVVVGVLYSLKIRRKYRKLKERYAKIIELESNLED